MREEGGTPAIVGSVRAGLAFQLKEAIGTQVIQETEQRLTRKALDAWEAVEGLQILGGSYFWVDS
jgi:selenocysteine lyase/cysteine desulfurase